MPKPEPPTPVRLGPVLLPPASAPRVQRAPSAPPSAGASSPAHASASADIWTAAARCPVFLPLMLQPFQRAGALPIQTLGVKKLGTGMFSLLGRGVPELALQRNTKSGQDGREPAPRRPQLWFPLGSPRSPNDYPLKGESSQ